MLLSLFGKQYVFTKYYKNNKWGNSQSRSGDGSTIDVTEEARHVILSIIKELNIKKILDAPCGDFNWMKLVVSDDVDYIGVDIVGDLIRENNKEYARPNIEFMRKDICNDNLPMADLIICRDALVHLSNANINKALINFKKSGSKYLLATTFPKIKSNEDIYNGMWRPINMCEPPYNMGGPLFFYDEKNNEIYGSQKKIALWRLN